MRVCFAPQTTDVDHIIQPYIRSLLDRYDAVIVSPYMGTAQFKPFGNRAIVDCRNHLDLRSPDGRSIADIQEAMALRDGLGVLVCEGHNHELHT